MKLIYRNAPWLEKANDFVMEVWHKQGITNRNNATGMDSFSVLPKASQTETPLLYDAAEDEFYRYELHLRLDGTRENDPDLTKYMRGER